MASRSELYSRMGLTKSTVGPLLDAIFEIEETQRWREDLFNAPHGDPWHVSFHASSFPGDDPKACARKAIYGLMNIPDDKPVDMGGRMVMEAGKAIENSIVWRLARSGLLLSEAPDSAHQTGYVIPEIWLTGSPDAVINLPKKRKPHVIEIKGKDHEVIEDMKQGKKLFDPPHRNQLLTYIGMTRTTTWWPDLDDCDDGTLLYVSRNRPGTTHEFHFNHDEDFMQKGFVKLAIWKEQFKEEELPARPKDWKWTEQPCRFCPVKRYCKQDVKDKVTKLFDSNTIKHAKEVYGKYDYDKTYQKVIDRWKDDG